EVTVTSDAEPFTYQPSIPSSKPKLRSAEGTGPSLDEDALDAGASLDAALLDAAAGALEELLLLPLLPPQPTNKVVMSTAKDICLIMWSSFYIYRETAFIFERCSHVSTTPGIALHTYYSVQSWGLIDWFLQQACCTVPVGSRSVGAPAPTPFFEMNGRDRRVIQDMDSGWRHNPCVQLNIAHKYS